MSASESPRKPTDTTAAWREEQLRDLDEAIAQAEDGDLVDNDEACGWLDGFILQHDR